jgi:hypothetical protein
MVHDAKEEVKKAISFIISTKKEISRKKFNQGGE